MTPYKALRPTMFERTERRVLSVAADGDNPLGLETTEGITHEFQLRLRMNLLALDDEEAARIATSLADAHQSDDGSRGLEGAKGDLDEISAILLTHMGVIPLTVAWLARTGEGVTLYDGDQRLGHVDVFDKPSSDECETIVDVADGVKWLVRGAMAIEPLPDVVAGALVGRPLSDAVSHPALDGLGMTIVQADIEEVDGEPHTVLRVDRERRMMSAADLLDMHQARR